MASMYLEGREMGGVHFAYKWNRELGELERGGANGLVKVVRGPISKLVEFVPAQTERESSYKFIGEN